MSKIALVRERLLRDGYIRNYDAIYRMGDHDGDPARNTRLPDTILRLKKKGWVIDTTYEGDSKLATYVLVSAPNGATGRRPEGATARRTSSEPPAKGNTSLAGGKAIPWLVCSDCARRLARPDMERHYGWCEQHGMMPGEEF